MITVFRIGHRIGRDTRISTHCGLVARAFGADNIVYSGDEDKSILSSVENVTLNWGGTFRADYEKSWRKIINDWKGDIVHLTMYGMPLQDKIGEIRKSEKDLLVIVGGEKVPGEVYQKATWNIGVTGQPHSEIAALSVFLHDYFEGKELGKIFPGGKKIVPMERGKKVISSP